MWIALAIIVSVYLGLFILESLWKFVLLTPPKIYGEQIEVIQEYIGRNAALEKELREPAVSPEEERKRRLVAGKIKNHSVEAKKVLRCIMDHGTINSFALQAEVGFSEIAVNEAVIDGIAGSLILSIGNELSINPAFASALDYLLTSECL